MAQQHLDSREYKESRLKLMTLPISKLESELLLKLENRDDDKLSNRTMDNVYQLFDHLIKIVRAKGSDGVEYIQSMEKLYNQPHWNLKRLEEAFSNMKKYCLAVVLSETEEDEPGPSSRKTYKSKMKILLSSDMSDTESEKSDDDVVLPTTIPKLAKPKESKETFFHFKSLKKGQLKPSTIQLSDRRLVVPPDHTNICITFFYCSNITFGRVQNLSKIEHIMKFPLTDQSVCITSKGN